jgi:hypothetical protein
MVSFGHDYYVVPLVPVLSASRGDVQFVMRREVQSGKVRFLACGILPHETHVAATIQVLLRETGSPFSSDDL